MRTDWNTILGCNRKIHPGGPDTVREPIYTGTHAKVFCRGHDSYHIPNPAFTVTNDIEKYFVNRCIWSVDYLASTYTSWLKREKCVQITGETNTFADRQMPIMYLQFNLPSWLR